MAERMFMSNALERKVEELSQKPAAESDEGFKQLRKDLAEALKSEYAAKLEVDQAQGELDAFRKALAERDPGAMSKK